MAEPEYAWIKWGKGKSHLYQWSAITTACGMNAPTDWTQVPYGITYGHSRHWRQVVTCSNCTMAATVERLGLCRI